MVALIITGCLLMSYFFMALTAIIKGISALIDTMIEMVEVWAVLLLGGIGIGVVKLLVGIFGGNFWNILLTAIVIVVIVGILAYLLSFVASILLVVFELAINILAIVYGVLELVLEKLGEWSELGLKYFLGIINKKIVLS